jgi:hypothetical protein
MPEGRPRHVLGARVNRPSSIEGVFTRSCCSVVSRWCLKAPVGVWGLSTLSAFCRTFVSGGTRIRTGDTMIFSRRPLGMRKTRMGKRISVNGLPVGTAWFCPYCCATVDTALFTLRGTGSRTCSSARLTRPLGIPGIRYPSETYVSGRNPASSPARPFVCLVDIPAPQNALQRLAGALSQRGTMDA